MDESTDSSVVAMKNPCFFDVSIEEAIRTGDLATANSWLATSDVNKKLENTSGKTALHLTADHKAEEQLGIVTALLEAGAETDQLDDDHFTALYYAARNGHVNVVKKILEHRDKRVRDTKTGKKPRMGSERDCDTPVHIAAEMGHLGVLQALIGNEPECVTFIGSDGEVPLHHAAKEGHVMVVEEILSVKRDSKYLADVDHLSEEVIPSVCFTALYYAAERGHVKVVKKLLEHRFWEDGSTDEGREKNARMGSKEGCDTPAHVAAEKGHLEVVRELIRKEPECVTSTDISGEIPLHVAAKRGRIEIVEVILLAKCNSPKKEWINIMSKASETPLHSAAENGSRKVVEILLDHGAIINPDGDENTKTPLHKAVLYGHPDLALFLLNKGAIITAWAFQEVLNEGYERVAKAAIDTDHWPLALRGHYKRHTKQTTAFRELILKMPEVAQMVLDRCIIPNPEQEKREKPEYDVLYYYEFLEDFEIMEEENEKESYGVSYEDVIAHGEKRDETDSAWPSETFTKDNHPLQIMVKKERLKLLTHPVILSLIHGKWRLMGRSFYYTNLSIYIVYLIFLTGFALLVPNPLGCQCSNVTGLCSNNTINRPEYSRGVSNELQGLIITASIFVLLLASFRLLLELIQFIQRTASYGLDCKKRPSEILRYLPQYLSDWENWVEIAHYASSIAFVLCVYTADSFCVSSSQWQVGVCAMFLGWFVFILFVSKLPIVGIYVIILLRITWTFVKLFGLAVLLVVAFGLTFFMMFTDFSVKRSPFSDVPRSLLKTMTMTTGELDYDAIFRIDPAGRSDDLAEIAYPPISYIVWIVFIILMPVILTNMLTSLAVGDTNDVLEEAQLQKLSLLIDLVLTIEEVQILFNKWLPRRFKRSQPLYQKVYPKQKDNKLAELEMEFWGGDRYDQSEVINRILDPPQEEALQRIQTLEGDIKGMRDDMKEIKEEALQRIQTLEGDIKGMRDDMKEIKAILQELIQNKPTQSPSQVQSSPNI